MGLILPILALAVLASISPVTLVVFILLLATTRARLNAFAFLVGWTVSLTVVFALSYLLGTYHGLSTGGGGTALDVFEVVLGVGLHRHRRSGSGGDGTRPAQRRRGLEGARRAAEETGPPWRCRPGGPEAAVEPHRRRGAGAGARPLGGSWSRSSPSRLFAVVSTATVGAIYVYYARDPAEADAASRGAERPRRSGAGPTIIAVASPRDRCWCWAVDGPVPGPARSWTSARLRPFVDEACGPDARRHELCRRPTTGRLWRRARPSGPV